MVGECVCTCHVTGGGDREEDGGEVGDELGLKPLRCFDYFRVRGEDWVDLVRSGGIFNADVAVDDQGVV